MKHFLATILVLAACGDDGMPSNPDDGGGKADGDTQPRPLPVLQSSLQRCKLLSNLNTSDPTPNDVQHRANVLGADLGIPVVHGDTLYIMFGDTIGYRAIWGAQSHPDSVGYSLQSAAAVAADPSLLCNGLGIIRLPKDQSIGDDADPTVEADFAGVYMRPPAGELIGSYIHNPAGGNGGPTFPNLPGDFEVPSGTFEHAGALYIFYTTVVSPSDITMKGSYLAKWSAPGPTNIPAYDILYGVDQRFDANGQLGGNFINIAAEVQGEYVYLFGTGQYRASGVQVARKRLDTLATVGGFEDLGTAFTTPGYGETSVQYFPQIDRWMFLAEELLPASNRIVARFADQPEGPWSDAIIVHDMGDPAFRSQYCCAVENQCQGQQFFNCARTGFYGSYLLPDLIMNGDGSFTVTYTLSSFDPYNVALYSATFK